MKLTGEQYFTLMYGKLTKQQYAYILNPFNKGRIYYIEKVRGRLRLKTIKNKK